ncbi:MAG: hypothetical protein ACLPRH_13360, partial [Syntrophobacteraceae bacterium]
MPSKPIPRFMLRSCIALLASCGRVSNFSFHFSYRERKYVRYQVAFKCVPKEAEKLGELCPSNLLAATLLFKNGAAAAAQQVLGNRRRR